MNVEKTMEFILEQQAKNEVLHAKNEALHARHEARFAKLESGHAEHKVEIKEIRRLLLRAAAVGVEVRREMRSLAAESRETKREVRDLTRALRGRPGNGGSRHGGERH
jgi:cell division protein FtsB